MIVNLGWIGARYHRKYAMVGEGRKSEVNFVNSHSWV